MIKSAKMILMEMGLTIVEVHALGMVGHANDNLKGHYYVLG